MLILPNYAQNYAGTIDSSLPRTHPWVLIDCIHPSLSTYGLPPSDKMVPKRWPRNLSKNWSKKGSKNWSKKWSKNSPIVQGSNSPVQIYTMSKSGTLGETLMNFRPTGGSLWSFIWCGCQLKSEHCLVPLVSTKQDGYLSQPAGVSSDRFSSFKRSKYGEFPTFLPCECKGLSPIKNNVYISRHVT